MNLHEHAEKFIEIIQATADHLSIPAVYVEKDYWVTYILRNLSRSDYKERLIFKGGTALSKAYKLIRRFSEDIDLAAHLPDFSGNQIKNYIRDAETQLTEGLTYLPEHPGESKHGSFRKTWFEYSRQMDGEFAQASPFLLLEINAFTTPEPYSLMPVSTLIAEFLDMMGRSDLVQEFGLAAFEVNVLNIERTVAEKIMGLVRASREENAEEQLKAKIRHIYDLCLIRRDAKYAGLFTDDALLPMLKVVEDADRQQFRHAGSWLDSPLHEAVIFSDAASIWQKIRVEFHTRFAPLVYDGDIPEDDEVISLLDTICIQLRNYAR
ncbi:TPA: nucleotidyl transferase AbiEii/AbiGii toxin family protein [Klebsiella quasipneumoniae subsp. similipneumoniae]|nr:nucleotidyl transferase AbiEii/AbiGii toxin family protein [Klebsiella quasipneumoniae subsp. similipneumoniae]